MVCLQEDSRGSVFKCGKQGHRARDCRSNILGNGNNRTYTRTCCYCKAKGHIAANCPKLKAKRQREQGLSVFDKDIVFSCMLCEEEQEHGITLQNSEEDDDINSEVALTVVDDLDELAMRSVDKRREFSQIFIADTGTSGHMSGSTKGMTNLRKCNDSVVV